MLNKIMRKRIKAGIFFIAMVITLFAVNSFYLNSHNPMLEVEQQDINTTRLTPQKLFDYTWQKIKNEYYG